MSDAAVCDECGKVRTNEPDYSAIQVIMGQPLGWYSGDDAEICPEDMDKTLRQSGK